MIGRERTSIEEVVAEDIAKWPEVLADSVMEIVVLQSNSMKAKEKIPSNLEALGYRFVQKEITHRRLG